jgi:GPH family glycoside/pentoside/hexuronide:cation symporter
MRLTTRLLAGSAIAPDVLDLDELNTGQRREGIFCGLMVQIQKIAVAIAKRCCEAQITLFLVGKILDGAGFIPSSSGQVLKSQPESALLAIRLLMGPVPALVLIGGLVWAYFYPITRSMHGDILLKLLERRNAQSEHNHNL